MRNQSLRRVSVRSRNLECRPRTGPGDTDEVDPQVTQSPSYRWPSLYLHCPSEQKPCDMMPPRGLFILVSMHHPVSKRPQLEPSPSPSGEQVHTLTEGEIASTPKTWAALLVCTRSKRGARVGMELGGVTPTRPENNPKDGPCLAEILDLLRSPCSCTGLVRIFAGTDRITPKCM